MEKETKPNSMWLFSLNAVAALCVGCIVMIFVRTSGEIITFSLFTIVVLIAWSIMQTITINRALSENEVKINRLLTEKEK